MLDTGNWIGEIIFICVNHVFPTVNISKIITSQLQFPVKDAYVPQQRV